jgi:hypothetical protein
MQSYGLYSKHASLWPIIFPFLTYFNTMTVYPHYYKRKRKMMAFKIWSSRDFLVILFDILIKILKTFTLQFILQYGRRKRGI